MKRTEKNQRPHAVFVVEGEGDKAFWTKIGAAWNHARSLLRVRLNTGCRSSGWPVLGRNRTRRQTPSDS